MFNRYIMICLLLYSGVRADSEAVTEALLSTTPGPQMAPTTPDSRLEGARNISKAEEELRLAEKAILIKACDEMESEGPADGPWIPCNFLPDEFVDCQLPVLANPSLNLTKPSQNGTCLRFGGNRHGDVMFTNVTCYVLGCTECYGPRMWTKEVPCIKYTGHYFLSTLLYSIFLGIIAVDRFCLGYAAIAVGKLMTLGGLGVWWIIDICLLITGNLMPADDSNWEEYY
ncbi:unnamed protein product, partial [Mesorhabditis spiculigera]